MNLAEMIYQTASAGEVIAMFGQARLRKGLDGRLEVVGGSPRDQAAARAWARCFLDTRVSERPGRDSLDPPPPRG